MRRIIGLLFIIYSFPVSAQSTDKPRILYGVCSKDSLMTEPFATWYNPGYKDYTPNSTTVSSLKALAFDNISIKIFFGSWCGDSKREVPRFLKLLSAISFPEKKVQLIALGSGDSLVKQSPQHEEAGLGIYRVPTIIIYENGVESGRINEFPVYSLEKDLVAILRNQPYPPNYYTFHSIREWLNDGTLADENISVRGLAAQLKILVGGEYELNSLGHLFLKQGKKAEALKIFQVNYEIYNESAVAAASLGEGYFENGHYKKAITALERSLDMNKDPKAIKQVLEILYKAKEKEKS
jgi:tetratricopeptide (TPR) repeat protein